MDVGELEDPHQRRTLTSPPQADGLLDIYKLAVEMADRISARRAVASSFFLTALSTLTVLLGTVSTDDSAIAAPGVVLSVAWWALLRSYRRLNGAKYEVIQRMERDLPAAPYTDEWKLLGPGPEGRWWRRRYLELGLIEQIVPIVFAVMFVVALIA